MENPNRRYSHTSLSTFRRCLQRYQWKYVDNHRPLPSLGLVRGSVGHETLASWYLDLDDEKALQVASNKLAEYEDLLDRDLNDEWDLIALVLQRYFHWARENDNFEVVTTEEEFELQLDENTIIGFIDGIVKKSDNSIWLLEHKFQKQARTSHLNLDPQVSIYLWAARKMGYDVRGVFYNVIRMAKGGIAEREPTKRLSVFRNNEGLVYIEKEVSMQMHEMNKFHTTDVPVYRNPTRDCSWDCGFYDACLALNDDGQAKSVLDLIPVETYDDEHEGDE